VKLLVGLIGAGIQGSLSPALHEEEARYHGLRLHYQIDDVAGVGAEALPGLVHGGLMGFAASTSLIRASRRLPRCSTSCPRRRAHGA
jgi:shikimate dehydrogenase